MSSDPNDMMLELFRSEVDSHSESLTSSLLALEQDPAATSTLERMMRAAHSIKGAARIVRVDPAADVAHVMEDCFVAAQKGQLAITPNDVDVLLRGVDLLVKISAATRDPETDWSSFQGTVADLVVELRGVLERGGQDGARDSGSRAATASQRLAESPQSSHQATSGQVAPRLKAVVVCPAILDFQAAEQARRELLSALESGAIEIDFDLGATTDLDDRGLAFLAAAREFVAARSRTLRFQPVTAELLTVLKLTGLDAAATKGAVT